jgi:hypothetical protein
MRHAREPFPWLALATLALLALPIVLRAAGVLDASWWLVTSHLWGGPALLMALITWMVALLTAFILVCAIASTLVMLGGAALETATRRRRG